MTEAAIPPDWVLRGAASMTIRQHGADCLRHCLQREVDLHAAGDATGAEVWRRIFNLASELIYPPGEA